MSNTISVYLLAMDHLKCLNTKLAEVERHINILSFNVVYCIWLIYQNAII